MGKKTPLPRLEHIEDAAANIERAIAGKSFDDFLGDSLLRAGVERWTEIISEARRHVPQEMKDTRPEIAWRDIAGIGNVLRHDYEDIVPRIVWKIATERLGAHKTAIAAMKADWLARNPLTPPPSS